MRLCAKVVIAMRQWSAIAWAFALPTGARPSVVLLKFTMSKDRQVALRGHRGLAKTKLGLDKDLTLAQQACKSESWSLFKEAKVAGRRAFWCAAELFVDNTQICPQPLSRGVGTKETYAWYYGTCMGWCK
jgi:hypothetical protein